MQLPPQPVMEEDGIHQYWETVGGITNQLLERGIQLPMGNMIQTCFSYDFVSDTGERVLLLFFYSKRLSTLDDF